MEITIVRAGEEQTLEAELGQAGRPILTWGSGGATANVGRHV